MRGVTTKLTSHCAAGVRSGGEKVTTDDALRLDEALSFFGRMGVSF